MDGQSNQERLRIAADWANNHCPADLELLGEAGDKNAVALVNYCLEQFGVILASNLTLAYNALKAAGKLELKPEVSAPKPPTAEELAAKEIAKQDADYRESIKPQPDFSERMREVQAKKDKENAKKAQKDAEGQLEVAISGYQCYRVNGGGIDYPGTEMVQKELNTIVARGANGKRDFVRNLAVVRQVISELPDHPQSGDVAKVVESLNVRLRDAAQAQPKDSLGTDVKKVGALGGHR